MTIPVDTVSLADYQRYFAERINPAVVAYVDGYGADGITCRANRAAFDHLCLLPRVLRPMRNASTRLNLLGEVLETPVLIAPMAYHRLVHLEGECATARAAALTGHGMVVSSQSSVLLEYVAAVAGSPLWLQIYARRHREETADLVLRAEASGYRAIVLTVDAVVSGVRNVERRAGFRLPDNVSAVNLARYSVEDIPIKKVGSPVFQGMLDYAPDWNTLEWLCRQSTLPVFIKGVLHPLDAERAISAGVSGIIVSNHGGRVLDTAPAAVRMLPAIAAAVKKRVPVLLDGQIRRGSDIVKALALGANAVLIGRPVLHALAVGGVSGVAHMLTLLQIELEAAMALCGCARLEDIDASLIYSFSVAENMT